LVPDQIKTVFGKVEQGKQHINQADNQKKNNIDYNQPENNIPVSEQTVKITVVKQTHLSFFIRQN
jgi:hypothetical protein